MKKILIIEDNPINLKLVSDLLIAKGYGIFQANCGKDAFEQLTEHYQDIGLILLDLKLPDTDGIDVLKKLKANNDTESIPVIVVSAHAMENDIKESKNAGCADYITKPINIAEFLEKISNILKK